MLAAQIHGKLKREEEYLEDLLTSNVFGSIQYIPPEDGLVPILSAAERVDGSQPLKLNWSICIPAFQWKYNGITSIQLDWGSFTCTIIRWRFIK